MSKQEKKARKHHKSCEHRSDRRTAEFIVRRVTDLQDEVSDLLVEFRTFGHYLQIQQVAFCLRMLQDVKEKYEAFADNGVWPNEK